MLKTLQTGNYKVRGAWRKTAPIVISWKGGWSPGSVGRQKLWVLTEHRNQVPQQTASLFKPPESLKHPINCQLNWAILLSEVIHDGKNWVNCAVLTDNSAGLRTVLSSRLSHTELRSSFREYHSFLSLPANTTMASSQDTSVSSNSFSRWASHDIFLFKYHVLRLLFFFSDNIMADVASKQQTTALFLPTIVTRTRRHTELTKKLTNLLGNLCCAREYSVQFFVQFF